MNARQKAAYSFLGDTDPLKEEREGLDMARRKSAAKQKAAAGVAGSAVGALIGAYFGNPQLGAVLGKTAVGAFTGDDLSESASELTPQLISAFTESPTATQNGPLPPPAGPSIDPYYMVRTAYLGSK